MKKAIIITLLILMSSGILFSQNIFDDKLKRELHAYLEKKNLTFPLDDDYEMLLNYPNLNIVNLITNKNVLLEPEDVKFGIYGFWGTVVSSPRHILLKNGSNYEIFEMNDYFNGDYISYEIILKRLLNYFDRNENLNKGFLLPLCNNVIFNTYIYNSHQKFPDSELIETLYYDFIYDRNYIHYIE